MSRHASTSLSTNLFPCSPNYSQDNSYPLPNSTHTRVTPLLNFLLPNHSTIHKPSVYSHAIINIFAWHFCHPTTFTPHLSYLHQQLTQPLHAFTTLFHKKSHDHPHTSRFLINSVKFLIASSWKTDHAVGNELSSLKIYFLSASLRVCVLDFPFLKPLYNDESEIWKVLQPLEMHSQNISQLSDIDKPFQNAKQAVPASDKRRIVCVKSRRLPMTNAGTETAFRHDHLHAFPKSKHLWGQRSVYAIKPVQISTYIEIQA